LNYFLIFYLKFLNFELKLNLGYFQVFLYLIPILCYLFFLPLHHLFYIHLVFSDLNFPSYLPIRFLFLLIHSFLSLYLFLFFQKILLISFLPYLPQFLVICLSIFLPFHAL